MPLCVAAARILVTLTLRRRYRRYRRYRRTALPPPTSSSVAYTCSERRLRVLSPSLIL